MDKAQTVEITSANDWFMWHDREMDWIDAPGGAKEWGEENAVELFYMIQIEEKNTDALDGYINATDKTEYAREYISGWLWDKREAWLRIKIAVGRILREEQV